MRFVAELGCAVERAASLLIGYERFTGPSSNEVLSFISATVRCVGFFRKASISLFRWFGSSCGRHRFGFLILLFVNRVAFTDALRSFGAKSVR